MKEEMPDKFRQRTETLLIPAYDENVLDWDARIEIPPPRRSGTIRVKLEYKGRSKPIPIDDPWAE